MDLARYGTWTLVTGASSGIGLEFSRALAQAGMNLVIVARREERLRALASELETQHGVQCRVVCMDLAEEGAAGHIAEAVRDIEIGLLVNNAGFGHSGPYESRDAGRLADMVRVNCLVPVELTRAFLPGMLERKRGGIIFVSSILGFVPAPYDSVYAASKAFDLFLARGSTASCAGQAWR